MDNGKLALTRVDELERRMAGLEQDAYRTNAIEMRNDHLFQYVSKTGSFVLDFPAFLPKSYSKITLVLHLECNFFLETEVEFVLSIDGSELTKQTRHASGKSEFFFTKTVSVYESLWKSPKLTMRADKLIFELTRYSLNIIGELKQAEDGVEAPYISADRYNASELKLPFVLGEDWNRPFSNFAFTPHFWVDHINKKDYCIQFTQLKAITGEWPYLIGATADNDRQAMIDAGVTPPEDAATVSLLSESLPNDQTESAPLIDQTDSTTIEPVLGKKEHLAIAKVLFGRIYLAQFLPGEELANLEERLSYVYSGKGVAVAYDQNGDLHIARESQSGDLFIASVNSLSNQTLLAQNVESFDVGRGPLGDRAELFAVYVKDHKLYLRERVGKVWEEAQQLMLGKIEPARVRIVRGGSYITALLLTDKRGANYIIKSKYQVEASAGTKGSINRGKVKVAIYNTYSSTQPTEDFTFLE